MADADRLSPFFYGRSENRLNSKGQVAIPKRFREVVPEAERGEGFVLVEGEECCLYMYTHRQFAEVRRRVRDVAIESDDAEFFRRFMEGACAVDLDSQGRFVVPAGLRSVARIEGPEVLFIGMDDRIELWEPSERAALKGGDDEYQNRRRMQAKRIFGL